MGGAPFQRLAVLGLGLLGGSVALAARESGAALSVVGAGRRRAPLEFALERGIVDQAGSVAEMVEGADLVVLATPVGSMASVVREAAPRLAEGALVTDVGSVKVALAETLPGLLPPGIRYVGAHPMAGSHLRGVEHARADLFQGAGCAVTPLPGSDRGAVERVAAFWSALGARVVLRDPEAHDVEVAWTSHLPHVLAFAFSSALRGAPQGAGELAGGGFRDFTRIARSDAELWGDILCANRKALAGPLQECGQALKALASSVEEGDPETIEEFLSDAREKLAALENARSGGDNPEIKAAPEEEGGHQEKTPITHV
jgi:prephenate dehydrogenase